MLLEKIKLWLSLDIKTKIVMLNKLILRKITKKIKSGKMSEIEHISSVLEKILKSILKQNAERIKQENNKSDTKVLLNTKTILKRT